MKKIHFISFLLLLPFITSAQQQSNTTGQDELADAPWRMKKTDGSGSLMGIPVHIFIKDADGLGSNAELISLDISIKNSTSTTFGSPLIFTSLSQPGFNALFSSKSQTDAALGIQSFDASLAIQSSTNTIGFSSDTCSWPDDCTFTDITQKFWYFTFTIPSDKLIGFEDAIDIKVYFNLNWQTDVTSYLRVFRSDFNFPSLNGWYRGDSHFHSMYTNNSAEFGLPLNASKEAAKAVGLDWLTITDHSCDYDNYGNSMTDNWTREHNEITSLNAADSSLLLIHAEELSVNNSNGEVIHMLCYPPESNPGILPYFGDGDGDLTATSLSIDDILYPLSQLGGFAYAAHPFSGGDKLSSLIGGGNWNVGDTAFPENGETWVGFDQINCNNTSVASDIYSQTPTTFLFKNTIRGGEIWNTRNALTTTDQSMNPWNVEYDSGIDGFVPYALSEPMYHLNRLASNIETTKFLNLKGVREKNANPALQGYRFYYAAGSDAHGSFNYSNTDFVYGVVADIHDNAIGTPSTVLYCPQGMGSNGNHVLHALANGNAVMSDGPLLTMNIDTDVNFSTIEGIVGEEILPDVNEYYQTRLLLNLTTTLEFGTYQSLKIFAGTLDGEHEIQIPVTSFPNTFSFSMSLDSLMNVILSPDSISENEYFYLRGEVITYADYTGFTAIHACAGDTFRCYTNPIWMKRPQNPTGISSHNAIENQIHIFPNPANDVVCIKAEKRSWDNAVLSISDLTGCSVIKNISFHPDEEGNFNFNVENLSSGIYCLSLTSPSSSVTKKLVIQK
ncbi:MAG: T9SS type A sorting domain-containing protein [Bacteroidota bacterium]